MQISLWLNRLFLIGILIIPVFTGKTVLASDCNIPSPCESFSSAEAVFVGRLQKIVEDRNGTEKIAYFQIERYLREMSRKRQR